MYSHLSAQSQAGCHQTRVNTCILGLVLVLCAVEIQVLFPTSAVAQPSEANVLVAQAVLAYEDKRYEEARDLLTRARTYDPQHTRGLYYLGLTQLALQHPEEAVEPLESAHRLQPSDLTIQY